jgi:hypothetical protein
MTFDPRLADRLLDLEVRLADWQARYNPAFAEKFDLGTIAAGGWETRRSAAQEYARGVAGEFPHDDAALIVAELVDAYIDAGVDGRGELRTLLREHDSVWQGITSWIEWAADRLDLDGDVRWVLRAGAAVAMAQEFPDYRDATTSLARMRLRAQRRGIDVGVAMQQAARMAPPGQEPWHARHLLERMARSGEAEDVLGEAETKEILGDPAC